MTTISADEIREASQRIFNEGEVDYIDEVYAEDMVMHHVATGRDFEGREAFKEWARGMRESFPDFEVTIQDVIIGDEKFVTQWTAQGTQKGKLPGLAIEPTDEPVQFAGATVHAFSEGLLTEAWWYNDELGILTQLGLMPESPPA